MLDKNLHARVLAACTVDGRAVVPGDEVLVDENTLANLVKKGRLEKVVVPGVPAPDFAPSAKTSAPSALKPVASKPPKK